MAVKIPCWFFFSQVCGVLADTTNILCSSNLSIEICSNIISWQRRKTYRMSMCVCTTHLYVCVYTILWKTIPKSMQACFVMLYEEKRCGFIFSLPLWRFSISPTLCYTHVKGNSHLWSPSFTDGMCRVNLSFLAGGRGCLVSRRWLSLQERVVLVTFSKVDIHQWDHFSFGIIAWVHAFRLSW